MAGEITVVSNLTHAAGGSTVTGATTSDVIDDNSLNKRHSLIVQDVVSTGTEVADVGDVDTSKEYFVRLRNLETANPVLVFVTSSGTDVEVGRMKFGETWGPVRMKAVVSSNPLLKVRGVNATCQVEVIACQAEAT
jgi:hypothetical protein